MGKEVLQKAENRFWKVLTLEERADRAEKSGADMLERCEHPWALRHFFVNQETGETIRARCNRWDCLHCGPRKVDAWRQLVRIADPTLFLTLSKAGHTVEQAARAFQTFIQALRRGSKGRGCSHVGARPAYPVEYFAVLERHADFERNGFHWHVLIKGVDSLPYKEVIQPLWMSATHYNEETGEGAMIGYIQRIRNAKAIGYVTKYLTKALSVDDWGTKEVTQKRSRTALEALEECLEVVATYVPDSDGVSKVSFTRRPFVFGVQVSDLGDVLTEEVEEVRTVVSKAHRIRYSRGFFPETVAVLRAKLFEGLEQGSMELVAGEFEHKKLVETEGVKQPSVWRLVVREVEEVVDIEEYKRMRYTELVDEIVALRKDDPQAFQKQKREIMAQIAHESRVLVGGVYDMLKRRLLVEALSEDRSLSRRVISMWDYQRKQLRFVG